MTPEEELAQIIALDEMESGVRSPLRDRVPVKPSEGIDLPTAPSWLEGGTYQPPVETNIPWFDKEPGAIPLPELQVKPIENRVHVPGTVELPEIDVGTPLYEEKPVDQPPPSTVDKIVNTVDFATRPVRQVASKFLGGVAGMPWDMAAGVAALPAIANQALGAPGVDQMLDTVDWLRGQGQGARESIDKLLGVAAPAATPIEKGSAFVGESVVPYGKHTAALTAAMTALRGVTHTLTTPAESAGRKLSPEEKAAADEQKRVLKEQAKALKEQQKQFGREQAAAEVVHTIDSVGGPAKVTDRELKTLGGLAAFSLGMIFAPTIFRNFKFGRLPVPRQVKDALPGTMTISSPLDLARVYDDVNAPLVRLARKGGIDPVAVTNLENLLHMQTRSSAQALADAAIRTGRAETPAFRFQAQVPLADISRLETPVVSQYLHVLDTIDDIKVQSIKNIGNPNPAPGPITIRGMDLPQASVLKRSLEQANPDIIPIARAYRDNLKALRRFESQGEYATMSRLNAKAANTQRPNEVPWNGARVTGENVERPPATEALGTAMQRRLRERMENEVRGQYIDTVNNQGLDWFQRVSDAELKANPQYKKNTITMWRRGKPEHYTADPLLVDILKMDPYYFSSQAGQSFYAAKRLMEVGATGELAPWFALTSATRSYLIGKHTMGFGTGLRSPSILGSVAAIPQQLIPQTARAISGTIDRSGWLRSWLGNANVDALSTRLADAYHNSLYYQLETAGGGRGSILQQQIAAGQNRLQQAIQVAQPQAKAILEGYRAMLNAVHNAPSYSFARRNVSRLPINQLAMEARNMTGDPRIGGQFVTGAKGEAIRFEDTSSRVSQTVGSIIKNTYGRASEIGREVVPWYNATLQGAKRIGEAYLDNPVAFTAKAWLYTTMPEAVSYLASRAFDKDPNGNSYVDHKMNRRSDYAQQMNLYLPIPGQPAENGIEIPRFHEVTPFGRLMGVALDHAFRSSIFTEKEDFMRAMQSFLSVAVVPPVPPVLNMWDASHGLVSSQGVFGGEPYKPQSTPFDQNRGMPQNIELLVRALGTGIGDVAATGYASFSQTKDGFFKALGNAAADMGKRIVQKTPYIRDVTGLQPPIAGNAPIMEELFKKEKAIDILDQHFKKFSDPEAELKLGGASKTGRLIAEQLMGPMPPTQRVGLGQPAPTNPLYVQFMEEIHNKMKADDPEKDGMGMRAMWSQYGLISAHLKDLRSINLGNYVTWQQRLDRSPEQKKYLEENKVDTTNLREVRNFYEIKRLNAARVILNTIRSVETMFSNRLGKPFRIEDLDPYGKGLAGEVGNPIDVSSSMPY